MSYLSVCYAALIKLGVAYDHTRLLLPAGIGAGVGAAGGALIGGEDNRATGALGGALVGAGAGALGRMSGDTAEALLVPGSVNRNVTLRPAHSVHMSDTARAAEAEAEVARNMRNAMRTRSAGRSAQGEAAHATSSATSRATDANERAFLEARIRTAPKALEYEDLPYVI